MAGSLLLSAMLHILMEEKIGYNVLVTGQGPGTTTAFYALTGCETPNDVNDAGCGDGPTGTIHHVSIEGWTLYYPTVWDAIQKDYPATAPVNLGGSGYYGRESMYLQASTVATALDTDGATLDFFRSYNVSWHDQSKYFGGISSVNTSLLKPCPETRLVVHEVMQFYADFTGDHDGVETVQNKTRGKCWDGYFWLPPACRTDRSKCILFVTGGAGWTIEGTMQKATVWNMPIAPIVAKDWGSFVDLPKQVACLFYWWEPDPTFLLLDPTEMTFPAHLKQEWSQGIQTSAGQQVRIDKYVSYDLQDLAPNIVALVRAMDIDMTEVQELMMDQLNSGDDATTVACRWLQGRQNVWQPWLPDSSKCFPQFGLYKEVTSSFVQDRNDPAGLICRACESGFFSVQLEDDKGTTHVCKPCTPGSAQPSGAAIACDPCSAGEYQDAFGQAVCMRCPQGSYQDRKGQSHCKRCPVATSTLGLGSNGPEECRCEAGSINMESNGLRCASCGEGMVCPFASTVDALQNGTSDASEKYIAKIAEGYYSRVDSPTSIFKCTEKRRCPGGLAGTCAGGLINAPCAECPPGQTWSGDKCVGCDALTTAFWWVVPILLPSIVAVSYYVTNPKVTAKASTRQAASAGVALFILLVQTVSIMASTTIPWPDNFKTSAIPLRIFMFDLESVSFSCFSTLTIAGRYTLSISGFPMLVLWLWLCFAMSKLPPFQRLRWEQFKTWNTLGSLLQMSYGPMSALALQPFMCYSHPNGLRSLLNQPSLFCGEEEHMAMLIGGSLLLMLFVFGFLAVCTVAAWKMPKWIARGNNGFAQCFNFLTFRFRLDVWWFGVLSLVRMPVLTMALVLATDNSLAQAAASGTILAVFLVVLASLRPWKVPLLNEIDISCSLFILLLLLAGSPLPTTDAEVAKLHAFAASFAAILMVCFACGILSLILALSASLALQVLGRGDGNLLLNFEIRTREKIADRLQPIAAELCHMEGGELLKEIQDMNPYDLHRLDVSFSFLSRELFPQFAGEATAGISSKAFRTNIANASTPGPEESSVAGPPASIDNKEVEEHEGLPSLRDELPEGNEIDPEAVDYSHIVRNAL